MNLSKFIQKIKEIVVFGRKDRMVLPSVEQIIQLLRTKKRLLINVVLPLLLLVVVMLWLAGAFQRGHITGQEHFASTPQKVPHGAEMVTLKLAPQEIISEMMGEVKPEFKINVSSQITATIMKIDVRAGMRVKKGAELAVLDDRDVQARLEQTKESLARAEADLEYTKLTNHRSTALLAQKAISQAQYDLDHSRYLQAKAESARLRQSLQEAQVSLSYTRILSPADGVVIDRMAEVGDMASPGKALIVMFDPHHLWLQANVREEKARNLKLGKNYPVRIDALNMDVSGPLVEIVPSADSMARTVWARVRLPVNDELYPGMFGRLMLPTGKTEDILIPHRAIRKIGQVDMVDVKTPWGIEQRSVVVGNPVAEDKIEILSGLKPGEILVIRRPVQDARQ
ncbi:MAG: efflux RND transporter periplasmic adaptor subunit [Desulfomonilaceae bacterium]